MSQVDNSQKGNNAKGPSSQFRKRNIRKLQEGEKAECVRLINGERDPSL